MVQTFKHGNIEYYFERRRYGGGPSMKMFTWLHYRVEPGTQWETYGDPWPKARLSEAELQAALTDIQSKHKEQ